MPGPLSQNYPVLDMSMVLPRLYPASGNYTKIHYLHVSNGHSVTVPTGPLSIFHHVTPEARRPWNRMTQ